MRRNDKSAQQEGQSRFTAEPKRKAAGPGPVAADAAKCVDTVIPSQTMIPAGLKRRAPMPERRTHSASVRELMGGFMPLGLRAAASLLLLGLFAEWLLPLQSVPGWSEPHRLIALIVAAAGFLAIGLFILPWPVAMLLNGLMCAVFTAASVPELGSSLPERVLQLPGQIWQDTGHLLHGGLLAMSDSLKMMLLFAGLAMLSTALQSLVWIRQWGLGLMFLTASYLLALYAWFGLDPLDALLRIFAEGLLLAALLTPARIRRIAGSELHGRKLAGSGIYGRRHAGGENFGRIQELASGPFNSAASAAPGVPAADNQAPLTSSPPSGGRSAERPLSQGYMPPLRWWAASLAVVVLLTACGAAFAADKQRISQPAAWAVHAQDRIRETIESSARQELGGSGYGMSGIGPALSGYGVDDRMLGAPLTLDETPVFIGVSPLPLYWRGETKAVYDGRGWSEDGRLMKKLEIEPHSVGTAAQSSDNREGSVVTQTVRMAAPARGMPLFAAGTEARVLQLQTAPPQRNLTAYLQDVNSGALYPASASAAISAYAIQSVLPVTDPERLRQSGDGEANTAAEREDETGLLPYIQLPAALPDRVGELAGQIVQAAGTNRYDQVKAVEHFLKSRYSYTTADTSLPASGEDLADRFLFEQKQGYCVHFSTAMAVMLRTQGIPVRWVKGFAAGEQTADGGMDIQAGPKTSGADRADLAAGQAGHTYLVRAKDAHAWVEVYFPGAGWVPFDPTPGFAQPVPAEAASALAGRPASLPDGWDMAVPDAEPAWFGEPGSGMIGAVRSSLLHAAELAASAAASGTRLAAWAASEPAAAIAAVAAALALAAALGSRRLRGLLALALALRRYRRAVAAAAAAAAQRSPTPAPAGPAQPGSVPLASHSPVSASVPLASHSPVSASVLPASQSPQPAPAPLPPRGGSGSRRAADPRAAFLAAAGALWRLLHRRLGSPPLQRTVRGYAAALAASLPPPQADALQRLARWDEAARYDRPDRWIGPAPDDLEAAAARLLAGRTYRSPAQKRIEREQTANNKHIEAGHRNRPSL
ncbi:transglutaminase-like domain-containing protein [Paenibacillus beijingensis]|uniref:Transglutaminase-like domain-containing protein n=1 Tax=Paenibacillus beijingensis TaxID=1126833 RepID=A0A0D5NHG3_9BACL|nr:transglutaminase-like domain-containing protein [Paenibacillus beijingensis]AJY74358.1 hypothetical protein VN24_06935 [Paenibacillus beijingensis]